MVWDYSDPLILNVEKSKPDEDTQGKSLTLPPLSWNGWHPLSYLAKGRPVPIFAVCMLPRTLEVCKSVKDRLVMLVTKEAESTKYPVWKMIIALSGVCSSLMDELINLPTQPWIQLKFHVL
ncbi:hypothetical protein Tco_0610474 [Tanacetum coccineum]